MDELKIGDYYLYDSKILYKLIDIFTAYDKVKGDLLEDDNWYKRGAKRTRYKLKYIGGTFRNPLEKPSEYHITSEILIKTSYIKVNKKLANILYS